MLYFKTILILLILFQYNLINLKSQACEVDSDCNAGQICTASICSQIIIVPDAQDIFSNSDP